MERSVTVDDILYQIQPLQDLLFKVVGTHTVTKHVWESTTINAEVAQKITRGRFLQPLAVLKQILEQAFRGDNQHLSMKTLKNQARFALSFVIMTLDLIAVSSTERRVHQD